MAQQSSLPVSSPGLLDCKVQLPTLRLVETPRQVRWVGRLLLVLLLVVPAALLFVPWRQTVTGSGDVVAYKPLDRPQTVKAPVSGVVLGWEVIEGSVVKKGDLLTTVRDLDRSYLDRLDQAVAAAKTKLAASEAKVVAYKTQVQSLEGSMAQAFRQAEQEIEEARQKIAAAKQKHVSAKENQEFWNNEYFTRAKPLYRKGLISRAKYQETETKYRQAVAKTNEATADIEAARRVSDAKLASRDKINQEYQAKVNKANADVETALSDVETAKQSLLSAKISQSRADAQEVRAPRDGVVLRLLAAEGTDQVKAGDPLCVLVPETAERAVQLFVSGRDAPLIEAGDHVRLQFEGWPAVQVAGWPSVAVGTFAGEVRLVDATDSGNGRFRILVSPDPEQPNNWPDQQYLRQGARANGWVLLRDVSLGFELWRQLNGFPPSRSPTSLGPGQKEGFKQEKFTRSVK